MDDYGNGPKGKLKSKNTLVDRFYQEGYGMEKKTESERLDLSLEQIQSRLLQILIFFDSYCKDNNLRYWIAYGTLLGAVRHEGFIPWDDDVDVMMPREDFERLIQTFKDSNDRFFIRDWNNSGISNPFPKLCDSEVLLESWGYKGVLQENLWIDIFPVDGAPDEFREYRRWKRADRRLLYIAWSQTRKSVRMISKVAKSIIAPVSRLFIDYKDCMNRINDRWKKAFLSSSDYVTCVGCDVNGVGYSYFPRSCFDETVELEFCGHRFPAPRGYERMLEITYGDYLTIPPENQRLDHGTKLGLRKRSGAGL